MLLCGEECVQDRPREHTMARLSGHWSGSFVGNPPFPCLTPEAFQSHNMLKTWGPKLQHFCGGALLGFGAL